MEGNENVMEPRAVNRSKERHEVSRAGGERRARRPRPGSGGLARKALLVGGGITLIFLGMFLLVLPGPGLLCLLAGITCVGTGLGVDVGERLKRKVRELAERERQQRRKRR